MRLVLPLLLLTTFAQANELGFPYLSGTTPDGRVYVTSLAVENQKSSPSKCSFRVRGAVRESPFEPGGLRIYPDFFPSDNQATLVRAQCSSPVTAAVRVQLSRDNGRTFDEGRMYRAVAVDSKASHLLRSPVANVFFGETEGKPAEVTMLCRSGKEVIGRKNWKLNAHDVRLIELDPEVASSPHLTVEVAVVSGEGRIVVGQETHDADFARLVPMIRGTAVAGAQPIMTPIERLLITSSFKAAPFTDPATGLVFMRERWYDPKTGTFLGPDPMGYRDSSNPYTYGGGDPVNNIDPTGLALYAFDGTANTPEDRTNVTKLSGVYADGSAIYREGVGTNWYSVGWGRVSGLGGKGRVNQMYGRLQEIYQDDPMIDIIGFSRGAAQALDFANKIYREGVYDAKRRVRVIPEIRFLGVFDTVGSFGVPGDDDNWRYDLTVPPNVRRARHAVAANEYRSTFPLSRLWNTSKCGENNKIVEKHFRGAHSDIGGGYKDDYLSRAPLQWMWQEMVAAGITMHSIPPELGSVPPGVTAETHESYRHILYLNDWMRVVKNRRSGAPPQRPVYYPECH